MKDEPDAIVVFDLETTGIDTLNDRIVQAFLGVMGPDGEWIEKREWIVDPLMEIPQEASDVHGLSTEYVREHGVMPDLAIEDIINALYWYLQPPKRSLSRRPLVTFNGCFDLSMLAAEADRYGVVESLETLPMIDVYVCDKAVDKYRRGSRKLVNVAPVYDVPVEENAHDAGADCLMTGRVGWKLINKWQGTLDGLCDKQEAWADEQRQSLEDHFEREGKTNDDGSKILIERGFPVYEKVLTELASRRAS